MTEKSNVKLPKGAYLAPNGTICMPDTTRQQREEFLAKNEDLVKKRGKRRVVRPEVWIQPK